MNEYNIIRHIFKYPNFVNTKYMSNMILISDVSVGKRRYDVVIYKNGNVGVYESFSEYIDGKIAGGWLYQEDSDGFNIGLVIFNGDVYVPPEWKIAAWDNGDDENHMKIVDEQGNWFIIGEKTNYKMIPESEMEI